MPGVELIISITSDNSLFEYYMVKKDDNLNQAAQ